MRTPALLLLSLVLLRAGFAADDPAANPNQQQTSVQTLSPAPFSTMRYDGLGRLRLLPGTEAMCLKLRTYVVRRVDPYSDVTRLHSYTTCTPAWKFQTRSAVQRETPTTELRLAY